MTRKKGRAATRPQLRRIYTIIPPGLGRRKSILPIVKDGRPPPAPAAAVAAAGLPGQAEICAGNHPHSGGRVFPPRWESKTPIPTLLARLFPRFPDTPGNPPASASGFNKLGSYAGRYLKTGNPGHPGNRGAA